MYEPLDIGSGDHGIGFFVYEPLDIGSGHHDIGYIVYEPLDIGSGQGSEDTLRPEIPRGHCSTRVTYMTIKLPLCHCKTLAQ